MMSTCLKRLVEEMSAGTLTVLNIPRLAEEEEAAARRRKDESDKGTKGKGTKGKTKHIVEVSEPVDATKMSRPEVRELEKRAVKTEEVVAVKTSEEVVAVKTSEEVAAVKTEEVVAVKTPEEVAAVKTEEVAAVKTNEVVAAVKTEELEDQHKGGKKGKKHFTKHVVEVTDATDKEITTMSREEVDAHEVVGTTTNVVGPGTRRGTIDYEELVNKGSKKGIKQFTKREVEAQTQEKEIKDMSREEVRDGNGRIKSISILSFYPHLFPIR